MTTSNSEMELLAKQVSSRAREILGGSTTRSFPLTREQEAFEAFAQAVADIVRHAKPKQTGPNQKKRSAAILKFVPRHDRRMA